MKTPCKKYFFIKTFFIALLSGISFTSLGQVKPVPTPEPPLPPATEPGAAPADSTSIRFKPEPVPGQPAPVPIAPVPVPNQEKDTLWNDDRTVPTIPPDSSGNPRKNIYRLPEY